MMRSATAFLPDSMITFMNLDRSTEPNFGSGRISRLGTSRRRGISLPLLQLAQRLAVPRMPFAWGIHLLSEPNGPPLHAWPSWLVPPGHDNLIDRTGSGLLRALRAVLGTRLLAVFHALQVQRTADDVVAHTRQVLHPAAAHQHDAVLLQVVAFTTDVRDDLEPVGQANLGDLPQCGVRLLGGGGVHAGAHATTLGATLHRRRFGLRDLGLTTVAHELVDGRHLVTCSRLKSH